MSDGSLVRGVVGAFFLVCVPLAACEAQTDSAKTLDAIVSTFILEQRFEKVLKGPAVSGIAVAINEPFDLRIARAWYIEYNGFSTVDKAFVELSRDAEVRNIRACLAIPDYFPGWLKLASENLAHEIKIDLFRDVEDPRGQADWATEVKRIMAMLQASESPELKDARRQVADRVRAVLVAHPEYAQPFLQARGVIDRAGKSAERVKAVQGIARGR